MVNDHSWPEVRLGDVAGEITIGWSGPIVDEYVDAGIPFLRSLNVTPSRIETADLKHISAEFHERIAKSRLRPGDLVVVRTGRRGAAAVIPNEIREANCSDLVIIRPSNQFDVRFVEYYINSHTGKNLVNAHLVGSVQHHFNIRDAKSLRLCLPPVREQQAIVRILAALDDKIELNRRMNETLEAMAHALFQSWFVDFDPVRGKAADHASTGMAIPALFPSSFEESVFGEIPSGWTRGVLGDFAIVTSGKRPDEQSTESTETMQVPLYGGGGKMAYVREPLYDIPVIITGRAGTLGSVFRVSSPSWPSDNVLVALPRKSYYYEYLYFVVANIDFNRLNRGSTQPLVTQADLKTHPLTEPPEDLLKAFHQIAVTHFARLDSNSRESHTLAAIRDALLPKLLSGDIRVREAEKLVEATV